MPSEAYQDDEALRDMAIKVSSICLSPEFDNLRKELEALYNRSGERHSSIAAFEDALFTLLLQENEDHRE
ncbi:MAG TPA: hypothetical protein GXX51_03060 [Firmicutes bacterium]|nr:hypothetical protein [Bacillota bacterium]